MVVSPSSKKRLEKVTGAQYSLLRDLTHESTLDAAALETMLADIVRDRFEMARGLLQAAKTLARSKNSMVRRSAVSRAYYGAYQAARATVLWVHHRDEEDHERLGKGIDSMAKLPRGSGTLLTELRTRRNEFDYSPYPGPNARTAYDASTIEAMIKESLDAAEKLVRALDECLKGRR